MKNSIVFFCLLVAATSVQAQTITLGPITKLAYCVGDTMVVPYQASGTFDSGNIFTMQLSDSNGSFAQFSNVAQSSALDGTIQCPFAEVGQHFRVRIISSSPYAASQDNGNDLKVSALPSPAIGIEGSFNTLTPHYWGAGLAGEELLFSDTSKEPTGANYSWKFSGNPSIMDSTDSVTKVIYAHEGSYSATVSVTNPNGCTGSFNSSYYIASCKPIIPKSAVVVTGNFTTNDYANVVWVKPGGTVNVESAGCPIVYAEPGSIVNDNSGGCFICYLRSGASLREANGDYRAIFILSTGMAVNMRNIYQGDTFYCDSLQFDYSQVNAAVAQPEASSFSIRQSGDALFVEGEGNLEARIFNLLGNPIFSKRGSGTLDLDLSSLPAGIYFAVMQAGDAREVKRIAVVH